MLEKGYGLILGTRYAIYLINYYKTENNISVIFDKWRTYTVQRGPHLHLNDIYVSNGFFETRARIWSRPNEGHNIMRTI